MSNQLYFDERRLSEGDFYTLDGEIRVNGGKLLDIEEWIGRGGNASVYKGLYRVSGDVCAVKFLMNTGRLNTKRFAREAKLLKRLQGKHVTNYHGFGRVSAIHHRTERRGRFSFIAMDLADRNLSDMIRDEGGSIPYDKYASQFRGLAGALANLHRDFKALHRDIKPENILIVRERWLLGDYGLCTFINPDEEDLTPDEGNVGPKFWLSPEAHNHRLGRGDEICEASDVFQMAALFWYVATGRHPTGVVTEQDWKGPAKLFPLLHESLHHDYKKRPRDGGEFFAMLEDVLDK